MSTAKNHQGQMFACLSQNITCAPLASGVAGVSSDLKGRSYSSWQRVYMCYLQGAWHTAFHTVNNNSKHPLGAHQMREAQVLF